MTFQFKNTIHILIFTGVCFSALACDPDGKKKCDWVLESEPKLKGSTDEGYIPVCARNRSTMKEDCRLQATIEYAERAYERKFRYVDLRVESSGLPRTVKSTKFCDGKD